MIFALSFNILLIHGTFGGNSVQVIDQLFEDPCSVTLSLDWCTEYAAYPDVHTVGQCAVVCAADDDCVGYKFAPCQLCNNTSARCTYKQSNNNKIYVKKEKLQVRYVL